MLPDLTMRAWRDAAWIASSSASLKPVVPITCTIRAWAAISLSRTVACGMVKSIRPSACASTASGSSEIFTPISPMTCDFTPWSWPTWRRPFRLQPAYDFASLMGMHQPGQGLAHPASGAGNDEFQHGCKIRWFGIGPYLIPAGHADG
jgi:hypothetical protein